MNRKYTDIKDKGKQYLFVMSRQLRPQLRGVRVHDNVIRGKLKSHLLPCLSPAPSPGPRAESWVDICNAETKSGRVQNRPEPDLDLSQLIIIRHCRKVYSEIFDMLLWFGLLCYAVEARTQHGDTGHQTEVRLLRHAGTRHRHTGSPGPDGITRGSHLAIMKWMRLLLARAAGARTKQLNDN